ncbi:MAG: amidohydrolase family protein [Clostridiales bacterium]|nr:amidohydrolase family protein [Clostridiales bacterium]
MEAQIRLGECHAHMILDSVYFREAIDQHKGGAKEDVIRRVLEEYQQAGITYVRDGGDTCGVCRRAAELAPEYGIEYRMPVFAIHREGRYGKIVGFPYRDMIEFHQMVLMARDQGADFIKIMVSGILDFHEVGKMSCDPLPPSEIKELVHIVHEEGMAVMLHINGRESMLAAMEAGAESLEHGYYMDEECCQALGEYPGTVWVPSMAPVGNQIGSGRFPDQVLEKILRDQQRKTALAVAAGGRVALGSDAGAFLVPHVKGAADERRYLQEALREQMTEQETDAMLRKNELWIRETFRRH